MEENTRKLLVVKVLAEIYKKLFGKPIDDFEMEDSLEVIVGAGNENMLANWFVYAHEMLDITIKYMPFEEKENFPTFQDALTYFEGRVKEKEEGFISNR